MSIIVQEMGLSNTHYSMESSDSIGLDFLTDTGELDSLENDIDTAFNAVAGLESLTQVEGVPGPVLLVAAENMLAHMGYHESLNLPSMESEADTTYGMEGLVQTIKNIWKAIWNGIKRAGKAIAKFFKRIFGFGKKLEKVVDSNINEVKKATADPENIGLVKDKGGSKLTAVSYDIGMVERVDVALTALNSEDKGALEGWEQATDAKLGELSKARKVREAKNAAKRAQAQDDEEKAFIEMIDRRKVKEALYASVRNKTMTMQTSSIISCEAYKACARSRSHVIAPLHGSHMESVINSITLRDGVPVVLSTLVLYMDNLLRALERVLVTIDNSKDPFEEDTIMSAIHVITNGAFEDVPTVNGGLGDVTHTTGRYGEGAPNVKVSSPDSGQFGLTRYIFGVDSGQDLALKLYIPTLFVRTFDADIKTEVHYIAEVDTLKSLQEKTLDNVKAFTDYKPVMGDFSDRLDGLMVKLGKLPPNVDNGANKCATDIIKFFGDTYNTLRKLEMNIAKGGLQAFNDHNKYITANLALLHP